jgi:hypothetical protein
LIKFYSALGWIFSNLSIKASGTKL